ncbi:hypothetical protein KDM41_00105 [bacterium]|nr:hypothetical protein [bacterium]
MRNARRQSGCLAALAVTLLLGGIGPAAAQDDVVPPPPIAGPAGRDPSPHQDSVRLTRATSAKLPPDGLFTFGLQFHNGSTVYILDDFLYRISQRDVTASLEAGLLPWLHVWGEVPYRTWSGGREWIPESGSGLADGRFEVVAGRGLVGESVHAALIGGGNLPVGDAGAGLSEGVFSPRVAAALTFSFWTHATLPEMRLHLNYGRTWNRAEEAGFGWGEDTFQPWPPRYQPAAVAGGEGANDTDDLALALEFRAGTTSLWVEYTRSRFRGNDTVGDSEQLSLLGAGLRWGVVEGWAVQGDYLVSLADDDEGTSWWPAFPDHVMSVGFSRQWGFGGADRDGDGVRDRDDRCPDEAEDIDGFQDADGCPDPDNDMDGVPDVVDEAPNDPEDYDGFEDEDGVPDRDNDRDGIPDRDDLCPDEPEDVDGRADDDGCPDDFADRDGDGIEDQDDACPDEAEDVDGFEDDDGCPEDDNDLDGIPDADDACPDEAEDYDGQADDDGCPDLPPAAEDGAAG